MLWNKVVDRWIPISLILRWTPSLRNPQSAVFNDVCVLILLVAGFIKLCMKMCYVNITQVKAFKTRCIMLAYGKTRWISSWISENNTSTFVTLKLYRGKQIYLCSDASLLFHIFSFLTFFRAESGVLSVGALIFTTFLLQKPWKHFEYWTTNT